MQRVRVACQFVFASTWNIVVGILAIAVYAVFTTGSLGVNPSGERFARHYWPLIVVVLVVWVTGTIITFVLREKQAMSEPEPDSPPSEDQRIQVAGDNTTVVSADTITSEGGPQHFGPKYEDASLGTLMRGAMDLDLGAISQVGSMQGGLINAARDGIAIDFDSQGNVAATIDGSKIPARVTFGVKDPLCIVPGGDIDAASRDADTIVVPKEQLAKLEVVIDGKDVPITMPFDTFTVKPLPFGKATHCFLTVEGADVRIDNLLLEIFKLEGGMAQVTNKNQTDHPMTLTARALVQSPNGVASGRALDGKFTSSFKFDPAKARYVRQLLAYEDLMDALTTERRLFIRETATGEVRCILHNHPVALDRDEGQGRLIHALRCVQQAAGSQDLLLPQEFDDETRETLALVDRIVTTGQADIVFASIQSVAGLDTPRPIAEAIVQRSLTVVQLPLIAATDHHVIDLMGAQLDMGETYLFFPPLQRRITLQEVEARLAADPQEMKIPILWDTNPAEPGLVRLFYPRFLPSDWQEPVKAEMAARTKPAPSRKTSRTVTRSGPLKPYSVTHTDNPSRATG